MSDEKPKPAIPPSGEVVLEQVHRLLDDAGYPYVLIVEDVDCVYRRSIDDPAWTLGQLRLYQEAILACEHRRPQDGTADDEDAP